MKKAIKILGVTRVKELVAIFAKQMGIPPELHIDYVCNACCNACCDETDIVPDMRKNNPEESVEKWVRKFKKGYDNRSSVRKSKIPRTIPDEAIDIILSTRLQCKTLDHVHQIVCAHRLSMSAENLLGELLEEFLFSKLSPLGWALAWGETIKHVDFCTASGFLLQVKNRSNSENSSSNKVRNHKPIEKWYRVDAKSGHYEWDKLYDLVVNQRQDTALQQGKFYFPFSELSLNEESFQNFIKDVLKKNPEALAIEPNNLWIHIIQQTPCSP